MKYQRSQLLVSTLEKWLHRKHPHVVCVERRGSITTSDDDLPPKTTKRVVKKTVRTSKETSEPFVSLDSLFDDPKSQQVLASIDMARSMISEGKEDRDILRQLHGPVVGAQRVRQFSIHLDERQPWRLASD